MKIALIVVSWLLITATVLPLVRKDAWWIRVLDFPRIQITVLTAIVLIAFWLVGSNTGFIDPLLLTGLTLSLLYQSYMMYPYT
ncbi:MAG: endonuclease, partial [Chloroflexota bacterium]|nr:endonuclease [Chloroflexota bacterium]